MADATDPPREADELTLDGTRLTRETYRPWWGFALLPIEHLVGMLPTHKDSREGRRTAKRVRIGLGAAGFILLLFGGSRSPLLAPLGILLLGAAPFVPVTPMKKRTAANRLQRWRTSATRIRNRPARMRLVDGSITVSPRHGTESDSLELERAESAERRVHGATAVELAETADRSTELTVVDDPDAVRSALHGGDLDSALVLSSDALATLRDHLAPGSE